MNGAMVAGAVVDVSGTVGRSVEGTVWGSVGASVLGSVLGSVGAGVVGGFVGKGTRSSLRAERHWPPAIYRTLTSPRSWSKNILQILFRGSTST